MKEFYNSDIDFTLDGYDDDMNKYDHLFIKNNNKIIIIIIILFILILYFLNI